MPVFRQLLVSLWTRIPAVRPADKPIRTALQLAIPPAVIGVMCIFCAGCGTPMGKMGTIHSSLAVNDVHGAAIAAGTLIEEGDSPTAHHAVVFRLEQGAVFRAAGMLDESNRSFDLAEAGIDEFDRRARMKVSEEVASAILNPAALPYKGHSYDKIMLNTYKALNHMQLGNFDKARVELRRALERQRDAVEINARRIEAAEEAASQQKGIVDLERMKTDASFQASLNRNYTDWDRFRAYADYVNPLTVYLDGLFFLAQSTGSSDLERARKSFERAAGMIDENKYIAQDMALVEAVLNGAQVPPTTYLFFETGRGPHREQVQIDLPLILVGSKGIPYVGAAFPRLVFDDNYLSHLDVVTPGANHTTAVLSCMDSIIAQDFKNQLPAIVTRAVVSAAAKAAASYGVIEAFEDSDAEWFVRVLMIVTQAAMNQADLRMWTTLPKKVYFCRFPTPEDRTITLSAPNGQTQTITIEKGTINVVWIKSTALTAPLLVTQFKLK